MEYSSAKEITPFDINAGMLQITAVSKDFRIFRTNISNTNKAIENVTIRASVRDDCNLITGCDNDLLGSDWRGFHRGDLWEAKSPAVLSQNENIPLRFAREMKWARTPSPRYDERLLAHPDTMRDSCPSQSP